MGFEPTCPVKDNCISSAARYDRFDNSPCHICNISLKKTSGKRRELMERTKVISVVNNTAKAPKNQAFWRSGSKAVTRFRVRPVMTASIRLRMDLWRFRQPLLYSKAFRSFLQDFSYVFFSKGCKFIRKRVKFYIRVRTANSKCAQI